MEGLDLQMADVDVHYHKLGQACVGLPVAMTLLTTEQKSENLPPLRCT